MMGTSAQVASLRQQVKTAQAQAAQARRELEMTQDYLAHARQKIDKLEAEAKAASEIGELLLSTVIAAQELTGMVPGNVHHAADDLIPANDQTVVSNTKHLALVEALYRLQCFAEGKQPIGA